MRSKNLFALGLLLLSACAHVRVPDTEWCGDMGSLGASCFHTLTDDTRDIEKALWDDLRFGQVCTSNHDFAAIITAVEQLCSMAKRRCSYSTKQNLKRLKMEAQTIQMKAYSIKGVNP